MELATKTIMADSRIGSHSAARGTMRSLLVGNLLVRVNPREFSARLPLPGVAVKMFQPSPGA